MEPTLIRLTRMPDPSIRNLVRALHDGYPDAVRPYASAFESAEGEHGVSWRLDGAPAVFSAITFGGTLPPDSYDVQIESYPPGNYMTAARGTEGAMDAIEIR
jgi:hypothetical protein